MLTNSATQQNGTRSFLTKSIKIAMHISLLLALIILTITVISAIDMLFGVTSMKKLSNIEGNARGSGTSLPLVSLIVPACNEESNIRQAMTSLLNQDYPNFEIIGVNDRSADDTGAILDSLAQTAEKLKVLHIEKLPSGWMGKANALQQGADFASGEYLLFTDGDIIMAPQTVGKAVHYMTKECVDHLSLIFKNISPGWLLNSLILDAGAGLIQLMRPWRARKKDSKTFIGIGAFNMVRRDVYRAIGGHSRIRMHPIDDLMLGKLIKREMFSQECLLGYGMVSVPWYGSVREMVNGLLKNVLALINYRFIFVPFVLLTIFVFNILPLWGLFFSTGSSQLLFLTILCIKLSEFAVGARLLGLPLTCAFGTLLSPYITSYIIAKASWRNLRDGGIYWRGTHYPLAELRKNESLFS